MPIYKTQVLPENDLLAAVTGGMSKPGEFKQKQNVLDMTKLPAGGLMSSSARDQRAVPTVMTPGSVVPGPSAGGRVIDERGGMMAGPSVSYSPSMGAMAATSPRAEGQPQAAMQRAVTPRTVSSEVSAARGYTPQQMANMPGFVNYYAELTQPYTEEDRRRAEAAAISTAEQQYSQAADQIRSQLASRGLMAGGGTGLEAGLLARARMQAAGAREQALNRIAAEFPQKQAEYNMRRAEGMMRAQNEQFQRYVDEQLLPMKIAENTERVKAIMLENGVNQYAIDQYMKMDVNEWPDWVKNAVKLGIMGAGIYMGQPSIVAAGASFR